MISKWIKVNNSVGLHARPVSQLAEAATNYQSAIKIFHNGFSANLKNSARILALGINYGHYIRLSVEGCDEKEAFDTIISVFNEINLQ